MQSLAMIVFEREPTSSLLISMHDPSHICFSEMEIIITSHKTFTVPPHRNRFIATPLFEFIGTPPRYSSFPFSIYYPLIRAPVLRQIKLVWICKLWVAQFLEMSKAHASWDSPYLHACATRYTPSRHDLSAHVMTVYDNSLWLILLLPDHSQFY